MKYGDWIQVFLVPVPVFQRVTGNKMSETNTHMLEARHVRGSATDEHNRNQPETDLLTPRVIRSLTVVPFQDFLGTIAGTGMTIALSQEPAIN